ncbi:protein LURP-one-related 15-like isoform X2 [Magnolia sinica]|nr:protein LURP-one-related 15-like isoform X2 [Magnolia sinica]
MGSCEFETERKTETVINGLAMSFMGGTSVAPLMNAVVVVGHQFLSPYPVDLTVTEKTMSLTDGDYAVTDANGNVFFKVKGKLISLRDKRLLQDASGNTLLTMREKMMSMHRRWQAFRGESSDAKDLLFSVKKSSLLQFKTALDVFLASNTKEEVPDFKIQGSYFERSCTIYNGDASIVIAQ